MWRGLQFCYLLHHRHSERQSAPNAPHSKIIRIVSRQSLSGGHTTTHGEPQRTVERANFLSRPFEPSGSSDESTPSNMASSTRHVAFHSATRLRTHSTISVAMAFPPNESLSTLELVLQPTCGVCVRFHTLSWEKEQPLHVITCSSPCTFSAPL